MQCPKCGMAFISGVAEEEAAHSQYCDLIVNGPAIGEPEKEHVIWTEPDARILLVTDKSSEEQRKLAHDAAKCANHEMHYDGGIYHYYDPPDERQVHIFLYVRASRVVGMCLIEKRTTVWRCTWNENEIPDCIEQPERSSMWSVCYIWVHNKHRQSGIAYTLFKEAKRVLGAGHDDIGWYSPFSLDGKAFIRRQYPSHFFIAK